jgi:rhamnopyranosyl-N-acetylglucosaminyl-diphospho-decaprenol beta-1,3/1,4-galactofuranosyltransferase
MKVTAVIVTYNRLDLLKECIQSLKEQTIALNEIIVVNNNSSDGTTEWLQNQEGLTVIKQENLGGAGGQYAGITMAYQHGADWMWCMDDDAIPYNDALEKLIPYTIERTTVALACSVIDNNDEISLVHRGFFNYRSLAKNFGCEPIAETSYSNDTVEVGYATFVGILINRIAIEKIGLPKKEFFLHFDDIEYSLRLRKQGKILLVPSSKILHKENASTHFFYKTIFGRNKLRIKFENLWMRYYVIRNVTWGIKNYYGKKWDVSFILTWYIIKSVAAIILFDDHKIKRIRFFICAIKDGLSGKFINSYQYIVGTTSLY